MHTHTHKTHHSLDLGETTTFPLIVFFVISHGGYIKMLFFSQLPWDSQVKSFEIFEIRTFATLDAYNYLCSSLIEMRLKETL
jgi:hypothetical protein